MTATRVGVLVVGEVERSPRMCLHARSLASHGFQVELVGYYHGEDHATDNAEPNIHRHALSTPLFGSSPGMSRWLYLALLPVKAMQLILSLMWTLFVRVPRCDVILVQNPPAMPTLFVLHLVHWFRGTRVIVDWHNLGYSILALNVQGGDDHPLVRVARWYERELGRRHCAHLCVTKAMQEFLRNEWAVRGTVGVLYDRAPEHFHRLSAKERAEFLPAFERKYDIQLPWNLGIDEDDHDRPFVIVTSTSFTEDEDIGLLLEAVCQYDVFIGRSKKTHRKLVVFITGKGPLRSAYEAHIAKLALTSVTIRTLWLSMEDYPKLLGTADLGICLHTSSSKLDLPMKVVDMFGCGLPVCAVDYDCIRELVEPNKTGWLFESGDELYTLMKSLISDKPALLTKARETIVQRFAKDRWSDRWDSVVLPLLIQDSGVNKSIGGTKKAGARSSSSRRNSKRRASRKSK